MLCNSNYLLLETSQFYIYIYYLFNCKKKEKRKNAKYTGIIFITQHVPISSQTQKEHKRKQIMYNQTYSSKNLTSLLRQRENIFSLA